MDGGGDMDIGYRKEKKLQERKYKKITRVTSNWPHTKLQSRRQRGSRRKLKENLASCPIGEAIDPFIGYLCYSEHL